MKTMGFLMSTKENEKRRALLPEQIDQIKNKKQLYFEKGYGEVLGYTDEEGMNQFPEKAEEIKTLAIEHAKKVATNFT